MIGAVLGVVRQWKPSGIGGVLGFGAGALVSSISFELFEEGFATGGPLPLALGALLDGIPEQAVCSAGYRAGPGGKHRAARSDFVSNLPESIGSSTGMKAAGESLRRIITLWTVVGAACTLATLVGYAISRITAEQFEAAMDGFAAGALLVMLVGR